MAKKRNTKQITNTKINPDEKQVEYWRERAEREFLAGEKDAFQVAKDLKSNYRKCINEIEKEINAFYGKYAIDNQISLEEAKVLLNRSELKSFKENIRDILEMGEKENFTEAQMRKFKLLYAKTKISRLDELQSNIKWELDKLTKANENQIGELLKNTYQEGYYKTIFDVQQFKGFSSSFTGLNKKVIDKAINTKWLGTNYTLSLYKNENTLLTTLSQDIPRGLTLGYNPRKLAGQISKKLDTNYNNAVRLVRTEYAKILNDATLEGYKAAGITKYKLLVTLDDRTSDICEILSQLDEIYDIEQAETGVNLPPFHPNCRTTTVAYFPKDEIDEMSDEELDNIGFMTNGKMV